MIPARRVSHGTGGSTQEIHFDKKLQTSPVSFTVTPISRDPRGLISVVYSLLWSDPKSLRQRVCEIMESRIVPWTSISTNPLHTNRLQRLSQISLSISVASSTRKNKRRSTKLRMYQVLFSETRKETCTSERLYHRRTPLTKYPLYTQVHNRHLGRTDLNLGLKRRLTHWNSSKELVRHRVQN